MAKLLCLAYSRKINQRCVAGLRLDTLEWVRPVSGAEHGALSAATCQLDVGRAAQPLDVVRVPLKRRAPKRHQPENWLVREGEWKLIDKLSVEEAAGYLDQVVVDGPDLLGDTSASIDWDWIEENGVTESLAVVHVRPTFEVNLWDRSKLRTRFKLRDAQYDLSVTDLAPWTKEMKAKSYVKAKSHWYLTISLGERFDLKNRAYKLVAGAIENST